MKFRAPLYLVALLIISLPWPRVGLEAQSDGNENGIVFPTLPAPLLNQLRAEGRVALVVGNANYAVKSARLTQPIQDAKDMARMLRALGFEKVIEGYDLTALEFGRLLNEFRDLLNGKRVGFFYYSGHGQQDTKGRNFLLPVDIIEEPDDLDLKNRAIPVDFALGKMLSSGPEVSIAVVDACRNNPYGAKLWEKQREKGAFSQPNGLASQTLPDRKELLGKGMILAFAAQDGTVSWESENGRHSVYTEELLRHMGRPWSKVEHMFDAVQTAVSRKTDGDQNPPIHDLVFGDFTLLSGASVPPLVDETMYVATEENPLNVRDNPGLNGTQVIAILPRGTPVTVTGPAANSWRPVRLSDGRSGFVSASLLSSTPIGGRRRGPDDDGDGLEPGEDESEPIYGNGVLYLQTKRPRTRVRIDDADWGVIEGVRRSLPGMQIGQDVRVTLSRDWYKPWTGIVPIDGPENHTNPKVIELEPDFGHVALTVKQPDAEAWLLRGRVDNPEIDPASNGGSRLKIGGEKQQVRSGDWTALVRHPLYHPEAIPLRMQSGETRAMSFDLAPRHGGLRLVSDPPGADLTLAGAKVGENGVYENPTQLSGIYRVTARLACHEPWSGEVTVYDGRSKTEEIKLTRRCARVVVPDTLFPPDARLIARDKSGKAVRHHVGKGRLDFEPGRYQLSLAAKGYVSRSFKPKVFRRGSTERIPPEYAELERAQGTIVVVTKPQRDDVEFRVGDGRWTSNSRIVLGEGNHRISARTGDMEGEANISIRHKEVKSIEIGLMATEPQVGDSFRDCPACPEMVVVPSGSFMMGSPKSEIGRYSNEGPLHRVTFGYVFAVGKFEVTQAQWRSIMGNNPSYFQGDSRPVENVSWDDAKEYLDQLNARLGLQGSGRYRLLTESEWEYAVRAGTTTRYHCGNKVSCLMDHAWFRSNSRAETHTVGRKLANPWGLYDMHGNVSEWTNDCFHANYNGAPSDGGALTKSNCHDRVLRGGSLDNRPDYLRSANRVGYETGIRRRHIGLRVALTLTKTDDSEIGSNDAIGRNPKVSIKSKRGTENSDIRATVHVKVLYPEAVLRDDDNFRGVRPELAHVFFFDAKKLSIELKKEQLKYSKKLNYVSFASDIIKKIEYYCLRKNASLSLRSAWNCGETEAIAAVGGRDSELILPPGRYIVFGSQPGVVVPEHVELDLTANDPTSIVFKMKERWFVPACPYLYMHNGRKYVKIREILQGQIGKYRVGSDEISVNPKFVVDGKVKFMISEEKRETSMIDSVAASLANQSLEISYSGNHVGLSIEPDNIFFPINQGEAVFGTIKLPTEISKGIRQEEFRLNLRVVGYYIFQ